LEKTGHVWPVLQSSKNPRNTIPLFDQQARGLVAAGVKALIVSGSTRENAAKQAIKEVIAIRDVPWKRVLSWMDELGKARNPSANAHQFLIAGMTESDSASLTRQAKSYFQFANIAFGLGNPQAL